MMGVVIGTTGVVIGTTGVVIGTTGVVIVLGKLSEKVMHPAIPPPQPSP